MNLLKESNGAASKQARRSDLDGGIGNLMMIRLMNRYRTTTTTTTTTATAAAAAATATTTTTTTTTTKHDEASDQVLQTIFMRALLISD